MKIKYNSAVKTLVLFAILFMACGYQIPKERADEVQIQITEARSLAEYMGERWNAALIDLVIQPLPKKNCPIELSGYYENGQPLLSDDSVRALYKDAGHSIPIVIVEGKKLGTIGCPRSRIAKEKLSFIEHLLDEDTQFKSKDGKWVEPALDKAAPLAKADWWSWALLVSFDEVRESEIAKRKGRVPGSGEMGLVDDSRTEHSGIGSFKLSTTTTKYFPGLVSGHAYLFNYAAGAFICQSSFSATNSPNVSGCSSEGATQKVLFDDLRGQAIHEAIEQLRAYH